MRPQSLQRILPITFPMLQVMDIGAMPEGANRYDGLVARNAAHVTGFEPDPEQLQRLQAMAKPHHQYFPHVLGDGQPQTLHVTRYPGCTSLLEPNPAVIDRFTAMGTAPGRGNFAVVARRPVQTVRLDDVPNCPEPDFIKLDIQGAELQVLQSGTRCLRQASVLEVEVEFVELYRDQPLFGDIQCFLRSQGFVFHKFIDVAGRTFKPMTAGNSRYAAMSQALWADAIFVRDFSQLQAWPMPRLLKSALILHDAYMSYDLVLAILMEVDARGQTDLAQRYLHHLKQCSEVPIAYMNLRTN